MPEELGKLEKPEAGQFAGRRKLYFIPLAAISPEGDTEYAGHFEKYWAQVGEQLAGLELKLGVIRKIYHEFIAEGGEAGVKTAGLLNPKSAAIISEQFGRGAMLEAIEDEALLGEFIDWSRCLNVGLQSEAALSAVLKYYQETGKKRNEHLAKRIDETLGAGEAGILFMREGHQLQFAKDIQVIYVAPPALDELKRWLRERASERDEKDK
ncbi:MAG: hypothetical protein C4555_07485 [Dehalococcoidia bacterium]|nr:MAG: hypothetical protein C4555_07485 [Dehalococcoidia bacterium]